MVNPCIIGDSYSEREPSLSQLFDAIERKLDEMMGAFRYHLSDHCCLDRTLTMVSQLFSWGSLRQTGLKAQPNLTTHFLILP